MSRRYSEQSMAISHEQIEKLRAMLKTAPEAPANSANTTKQEAVRLLAGEIRAHQRRGYSLEQVAEFLKGGGLDLTTPTLKNYLSRAKAAQKLRQRAGERAKAGGGAKESTRAAVVPRVGAEDAGGKEKKETTMATPRAARAEVRPPGAGGDGATPSQPESPDEDDSSPFELDIEVIDGSVLDPELEHWFRKG
jgi:hypothetical protein